ncbi:MAG: Efflux ABC transporter, ATP-binding protein, partial [uncultured Gemmatimonadetes bacterium]
EPRASHRAFRRPAGRPHPGPGQALRARDRPGRREPAGARGRRVRARGPQRRRQEHHLQGADGPGAHRRGHRRGVRAGPARPRPGGEGADRLCPGAPRLGLRLDARGPPPAAPRHLLSQLGRRVRRAAGGGLRAEDGPQVRQPFQGPGAPRAPDDGAGAPPPPAGAGRADGRAGPGDARRNAGAADGPHHRKPDDGGHQHAPGARRRPPGRPRGGDARRQADDAGAARRPSPQAAPLPGRGARRMGGPGGAERRGAAQGQLRARDPVDHLGRRARGGAAADQLRRHRARRRPAHPVRRRHRPPQPKGNGM